MSFANPLWFLALAAVLLRIVVYIRDRRSGRGAFSFSSLSIVPKRATLRSRLASLPWLLELAGWILLTVALARPQHVTAISDHRFGIDIVIAFDASGSMGAEDFRPKNRFTVARDLIAEFIERRVNDRIGIVMFGARAATRVPITFDRETASDVLAKVKIGEHGDGTAIGHAIATATNRLRTSKSASKVIILLTDGVNNAGSIEPTTAATLARRFGVRIYAIGVGSRGPVPVPVKVQNRFTGELETVYQMIRADLDEEMLTGIARTTGGAYFRAVDERALESILETINRLEKSRLAAPNRREIEELYATPLAMGLLFLLMAFASGETIWMRLPA